MSDYEYTTYERELYPDASAEWSVDIASQGVLNAHSLDDEVYSICEGIHGYGVYNMAYIGEYEPGYNVYRLWVYSDSTPRNRDILRQLDTLKGIVVIAINGELV